MLPNTGMPASDDEFGFAASGDCLVTAGKAAFLITGGARSRVLRSVDRGLTWTAVESGIPAGGAAGGFAGAFASPRHGIAVGGDFGEKPVNQDNVGLHPRRTHWTGGVTLTHIGEDVTYSAAGRSPSRPATTGLGRHQPDPRRRRHVDRGSASLGYHVVDCVAKVCWAAGSKWPRRSRLTPSVPSGRRPNPLAWRQPDTMFASSSVPRHLVRGALGLPLMVAAFVLVPWVGPVALLLIVPAARAAARVPDLLGAGAGADLRVCRASAAESVHRLERVDRHLAAEGTVGRREGGCHVRHPQVGVEGRLVGPPLHRDERARGAGRLEEVVGQAAVLGQGRGDQRP